MVAGSSNVWNNEANFHPKVHWFSWQRENTLQFCNMSSLDFVFASFLCGVVGLYFLKFLLLSLFRVWQDFSLSRSKQLLSCSLKAWVLWTDNRAELRFFCKILPRLFWVSMNLWGDVRFLPPQLISSRKVLDVKKSMLLFVCQKEQCLEQIWAGLKLLKLVRSCKSDSHKQIFGKHSQTLLGQLCHRTFPNHDLQTGAAIFEASKKRTLNQVETNCFFRKWLWPM